MQEFYINWNKVISYIKNNFSIDRKVDVIGIIFLIGIQELGKGGNIPLHKINRIDILHIAICRILQPFGYYLFIGRDKEGWPHYLLKKKFLLTRRNNRS